MEWITEESKFHIDTCAVALGKFDGIHLGHQLLIRELKKAKSEGLPTVVYTFDRPPESLFRNEKTITIHTREERAALFSQYGIDYLVEAAFTKEFAAMSPEDFITNILVNRLHAARIIVGEDFHFGHKNAGDVAMLQAYAVQYGYEVNALAKKKMHQQVISSTSIRNNIMDGYIEEANTMLGRPFMMEGIVIRGEQIGRTIQFPTINLSITPGKVLPPVGVYAVRTRLIDGRLYEGMANLGVKPTIKGSHQMGLEVNLFDFHEDLYDQKVQVLFYHFIRGERKFSSIDELKQQIQKDKISIMKIFTEGE